jgi:hypothetical protein
MISNAFHELVMDTAVAREIIVRQDAAYADVVEAAATLTSSPGASLDDLISCLSRGQLPAELASIALHHRTGRSPRCPGPTGFITDPADWTAYVQNRSGKERGRAIA